MTALLIPRRRVVQIRIPRLSWLLPRSYKAQSRFGVQRKWSHRLCFSTMTPVIQVPFIFTGLFLTLWAYKCLMMVVFQNKIIYMPSMPPFARREKVADYTSQCGGVTWREESLISGDGTKLALLVGECGGRETDQGEETVILYFQGNGSSLPPRLPSLSRILRLLNSPSSSSSSSTSRYSPAAPRNPRDKYTLVALSYRGYWTSRGSPSEKGIKLDAIAALAWITTHYKAQPHVRPARIILWGQSLGAGVAASTAAAAGTSKNPPISSPSLTHLPKKDQQQRQRPEPGHEINPPKITALILETPFSSIKAMLQTIYPQRYLPYRYLHPFLRSRWDTIAALRSLSPCPSPPPPPPLKTPSSSPSSSASSGAVSAPPEILILQAAADELVPAELGHEIEAAARAAGLSVRRTVVGGSTLHNEVLAKEAGRRAVVGFIRELSAAADKR